MVVDDPSTRLKIPSKGSYRLYILELTISPRELRVHRWG